MPRNGAFARRRADAEPTQSRDAIRHQALAARLVDRRNATIQDADIDSGSAGGERRDQTGGTAADDDHVGLRRVTIAARAFRSKTGPMASSTPSPRRRPMVLDAVLQHHQHGRDDRLPMRLGCPGKLRIALLQAERVLHGFEDTRAPVWITQFPTSPRVRPWRLRNVSTSRRDCAGLDPSVAATGRS